ncbi:MAG: hypothetical protein WBV77_09055 [Solirubrobacteraceae bacterium]
MQHQRTYSLPYEQRRHIEAAILALMLAEDWPWRASELAQRLHLPVDVIGLGMTTLRTDGLLVPRGDLLRASWTAVRGDELAGWHDSNKRRARMQARGAAITLH